MRQYETFIELVGAVDHIPQAAPADGACAKVKKYARWKMASSTRSLAAHSARFGRRLGGGLPSLSRRDAQRKIRGDTVAKAYWVVCYRSISDPVARDEYTKLAVPAVLASGGRFLARGAPAKTYEGGINQRTVLVEFDSLAQAIAAHDSPAYQAALAVLGNAAERDLRIVEGVD